MKPMGWPNQGDELETRVAKEQIEDKCQQSLELSPFAFDGKGTEDAMMSHSVVPSPIYNH
jgi:hypothetical protein